MQAYVAKIARSCLLQLMVIAVVQRVSLKYLFASVDSHKLEALRIPWHTTRRNRMRKAAPFLIQLYRNVCKEFFKLHKEAFHIMPALKHLCTDFVRQSFHIAWLSLLPIQVYRYVCRGLFERHKQTFVMMLILKILQTDGILQSSDISFLLSGGAGELYVVKNCQSIGTFVGRLYLALATESSDPFKNFRFIRPYDLTKSIRNFLAAMYNTVCRPR